MSADLKTPPRPALAIAAAAALLGAVLFSGCSFGPQQPPQEALQLDPAEGSAAIDPTPTRSPVAARSPRVIAVATPEIWPTPFATAPTRSRTVPPEATAVVTPQATPTIAPIAELPRLAASLDEKIVALAQAVATRDADLALRLQQELLREADRLETLLRADQSAQAELVRQAIREIRTGAASDPNKLDSARAKLRVASGRPADSVEATGQGPQSLASKLQPKLRAFNDARKENRVDALLKLQQELLSDISQTEKALGNQHSDAADKLRAALQDLKSGLAGDDAKLESGIATLLTIGSASDSTTQNPQQGASSQQLRSAATSLDQKVSALRGALSGGSRDQLLQAQRDLLEEVTRIEGAIKEIESEEAKRLRDALAMARDGASGDPVKLEGASSRLADLVGSEPTPQGQAPRPSQLTQRPDAAAIANNLSRRVDAYKEAIDKGDRGAMLRLQQELMDQVNRDEEAVKGISGEAAEQLRSALSDLRNALKGDLNKLNSANATLRLVAAGDEPSRPLQPLQPQDSRLQAGEEAQRTARELMGSLSSVELALQSRSPDDLARAQRELKDAEDSLSKLPPGDAAALRSAINAAREALSGDRSKLDQARDQLKRLVPR